ncbi:MAG: ferric reductase-like transmembrane domain-containing protein [Dermatophilaceae bacterium]
MTGPVLWYANRGTGVVLLALMTVTTVLGVLATRRTTRPTWPRFVTQGLHRTLAGVAVVVLVAHAGSAVIDEYVDIRWWQALVPVGSTYQPLWLGIGVLSLDLLVVVIATSLVRSRLPHRLWSSVHLTAYVAWLAGFVHGVGIGTDSGTSWLIAGYVASGAAVAVAALVRVIDLARAWRASEPATIDEARSEHPLDDATDTASRGKASSESTRAERRTGERRRLAPGGRRRVTLGGRGRQ